MDVSILFARRDSIYKQMHGCDVWDADRNAMLYDGDNPIIAHPPCRAWGALSHMASPDPGEKHMAIYAVNLIQKNGGVLEHPIGSRLWKTKKLIPAGLFDDEFGGYTINIDQYHFGHVARKQTRLYICGCSQYNLPDIPFRQGAPKKSITGQVVGTSRCTQREREYTPVKFAEWLIQVAKRC